MEQDSYNKQNHQVNYQQLQHETLQHENLEHENMQHEHMQHENLKHENLQHEHMQHENLEHENLQHEHMQHENLQHENLQHEHIQHEHVQHENLQHENLQQKILQHQHLQHQILQQQLQQHEHQNHEHLQQYLQQHGHLQHQLLQNLILHHKDLQNENLQYQILQYQLLQHHLQQHEHLQHQLMQQEHQHIQQLQPQQLEQQLQQNQNPMMTPPLTDQVPDLLRSLYEQENIIRHLNEQLQQLDADLHIEKDLKEMFMDRHNETWRELETLKCSSQGEPLSAMEMAEQVGDTGGQKQEKQLITDYEEQTVAPLISQDKFTDELTREKQNYSLQTQEMQGLAASHPQEKLRCETEVTSGRQQLDHLQDALDQEREQTQLLLQHQDELRAELLAVRNKVNVLQEEMESLRVEDSRHQQEVGKEPEETPEETQTEAEPGQDGSGESSTETKETFTVGESFQVSPLEAEKAQNV